jgi:hypothetical protein
MNLQDLMDQAWDLACEQAQDKYDIHPNRNGDYSNSDNQVVNDLQTRIFEELGGDLDEYEKQCY